MQPPKQKRAPYSSCDTIYVGNDKRRGSPRDMLLDHTHAGFKPAIVQSNSILEWKVVVKEQHRTPCIRSPSTPISAADRSLSCCDAKQRGIGKEGVTHEACYDRMQSHVSRIPSSKAANKPERRACEPANPHGSPTVCDQILHEGRCMCVCVRAA
jgi:hypothetical protein